MSLPLAVKRTRTTHGPHKEGALQLNHAHLCSIPTIRSSLLFFPLPFNSCIYIRINGGPSHAEENEASAATERSSGEHLVVKEVSCRLIPSFASTTSRNIACVRLGRAQKSSIVYSRCPLAAEHCLSTSCGHDPLAPAQMLSTERFDCFTAATTKGTAGN